MTVYQSPIALLEALGIDREDLSPTDIKELRKRLLLELDIAGAVTLTINGRELSKQDILALTERLQAEGGKLHLHRKLRDAPRLLALLSYRYDPAREEPLVLPEALYDDLHGTEGMREFLSPYLGPVLIPLLRKSILSRDFSGHGKAWLALGSLLTGAEHHAFLNQLSHSLNEITTELSRVAEKKVPFVKRAWAFLSTRGLYEFFNSLPGDLRHLREQLAYAVNDLIYHFQHREPAFCFAVIQQLLHLHVEGEIRIIIKDNALILGEKYRERKRQRLGWLESLGRSALVLVLIYAVIHAFVSIGPYLDDDHSAYKPLPKGREVPTQSLRYTLHWKRMKQVETSTAALEQRDLADTASIALPAAPVYPYYYRPYVDSIAAQYGYPVMVKNLSDYHAVIFIITPLASRNFVLPAGRQRKVYLAKGTVLSCYTGRDWHSDYPIGGNYPKQYELRQIKGLFTDLPAGGGMQLSWFYPFDYHNEPNAPDDDKLTETQAITEQSERDVIETSYTAAFEIHPVGSDSVQVRSTPGFSLIKHHLY